MYEIPRSRVERSPAHRIVNYDSGGFFDRNLLHSNVTRDDLSDEPCWRPALLLGHSTPIFLLNAA